MTDHHEAQPVLTFKGLRADGKLDMAEPRAGRFALAVPGDVVFTKQGHVGGWVLKKVGILPPFSAACHVASTLQVVRPTSAIEGRWLRWWLASSSTYDLVQDMVGAKTSLASSTLQAIPIPVPTLTEQRRILDIFEDHLSRLSSANVNCATSLARLDALRRSQWIAKFAEPDEQAPFCRLLDVVTIANGQTPKGLADVLSPMVHVDLVPYFRVGDMNLASGRSMCESRTYINPLDAARLGLHIRPAGTLLLPKRGGAIYTEKKRLLRSPAAFDLNTMGLVPSERLLPDYLWHWMQGVKLARLADGSNVPQVNEPQIRGLHLPLPPRPVQQDIVERLDAAYEDVRRTGLAIDSVLSRSGALRAALLTAAFSGRLTGRGTDAEVVEEMAEVDAP